MSFYAVIGNCSCCKHTMSFNPTSVPSITIEGIREPVCLYCVNRANPIRISNGLSPIVPKPDAYEGCDEQALDTLLGEIDD